MQTRVHESETHHDQLGRLASLDRSAVTMGAGAMAVPFDSLCDFPLVLEGQREFVELLVRLPHTRESEPEGLIGVLPSAIKALSGELHCLPAGRGFDSMDTFEARGQRLRQAVTRRNEPLRLRSEPRA
jgi:hypothetical protein